MASGITILVTPGESFTIHGTGPPTVHWHVGPVQRKERSFLMPVDVHITNEEKIRLSITPMTPGGQPAPIDGVAQWNVQGDCTLEAIDATSAWVLSGSVIGDSVVTVTADADMGAGTVSIMDTATVHVESPMASQLGLAAGAPELKNPPA